MKTFFIPNFETKQSDPNETRKASLLQREETARRVDRCKAENAKTTPLIYPFESRAFPPDLRFGVSEKIRRFLYSTRYCLFYQVIFHYFPKKLFIFF